MKKTRGDVEKLLGRKITKDEQVIFHLMENDDRYEFKKGKDGRLEAHAIKDK